MLVVYIKLLWVQTGYAIWQFFRYTKFLRLPYVILSSLWNSGFTNSWFKKRQFLWIEGEPDFGTNVFDASETLEPLEPLLHGKYGYVRKGFQTSFKIGNQSYTFHIGDNENTQMKLLLSYYYQQQPAFIAYKILPIYNEVFVIKCVTPEKSLEKVAGGAKVYLKREFCLVDATTEDYLNENFMRIMSILPLSLRAKSFDEVSITLSAVLLVLDAFSVPANWIWKRFCDMFIKYTKLMLAKLPPRIRDPMHYVLCTGSEEFMFTDHLRRKSYWMKGPADFLVQTGNRMDDWELKEDWKGANCFVKLTDENKVGEFQLCGHQVTYEISEADDGIYKMEVDFNAVSFAYGASLERLESFLYTIKAIDNLRTPPVKYLRANGVYFSYFNNLRDLLWKLIDRDKDFTFSLYTSPGKKIYCN